MADRHLRPWWIPKDVPTMNIFSRTDYFDVICFADHSRQVEIHKPGCKFWRAESDKHWDDDRPYLRYEMMAIGPLEDAERAAERTAKEQNYPGWKMAECCFNPDFNAPEPEPPDIAKRIQVLRRRFKPRDYHEVVIYADKSRCVEVHKPGCKVWRKEELELRKDNVVYVVYEQTWGPLENAVKNAREQAERWKYTGWKMAECCFY